jgi:hypothetical protein
MSHFFVINRYFTQKRPDFSEALKVQLLNDGAKRNRLLYLKIMYTAIRKMLDLPKFFAFFSNIIDSLTLKVMITPYFPQIFCLFLQ